MDVGSAEQLQPLSYYLRHKLNEDCLLTIFSYLDSVDLMQICDLDTENDQFFVNLIKHNVISKKLVCASTSRTVNSWTITKTLETFRGMIRRLKVEIPSHLFNDFIRDIVTNCPTDTLVELQIVLRQYVGNKERVNVNQDLLNEAIPHFRSIEALKVHDYMSFNSVLELFVALVMNNAVTLRSLHLNGVRLHNLPELLAEKNYNLTELDLFDVDLLKEEPVRPSPRRHRQYDGYYGNDSFHCGYFNYCEDDHDYENRCSNDHYTDNEEDDNDDYYELQEVMRQGRFNSRILNIFQKFPHLQLFACNEKLYSVCSELETELKQCCPRMCMVSARCNFRFENFQSDGITVTLKTMERDGRDIKDTLEILATKNKLQKLEIEIDFDRIERKDVEDEIENAIVYPNGFASLRELTLRFKKKMNSNMGPFTRNVILPMRGLKTIQFSSNYDAEVHTTIDELEVIPSTLDFVRANLLPTEAEFIIRAIQNKFRQEEKRDPINVIVRTTEQAKYFQREGEVIDQFIKLSVKDVFPWF